LVAKQADIVLHYSRPLAPTVGETEQMKLHFKHYHLRRLGPSLSGNTYNEKLFIVLFVFLYTCLNSLHCITCKLFSSELLGHVLYQYILSSRCRVILASEMNSITASEAHRIALNGDTVGCMFVRCNSSSSPIKREVENVTRIQWYVST